MEAMSFDNNNNNNNTINYNDSSSYDSDSDDFLLTTTGGTTGTSAGPTAAAGGGVVTVPSSSSTTGGQLQDDREALIRKKLLENFYGKSVVSSSNNNNNNNNESGVVNTKLSSSRGSSSNRRNMMTKNDDHVVDDDIDNIDSVAFDANRYVTNHIRTSSIHTLLEVEEQLSLQVRTYDSTMQTLVYENYTRFIDATDAIKSITTNVTANEAKIQQLIVCTNTIYDTSRDIMNEEIGTIRDQVVEKIRIQRLLQRLNRLFTLPQTIQELIRTQEYRTAIQKYNTASSILAKYTSGLDSFVAIATECTIIVQQLYQELQQKIHYWSGRSVLSMKGEEEDDIDTDDDNDETTLSPLRIVPDLPKSMMEIFNCVSAVLLLQEQFHNNKTVVPQQSQLRRNDDDDNESNHNSSTYTEDVYAMSLNAATRLLDRLLDAHSIQVQEHVFLNHNVTTTTDTATASDYDGFMTTNNNNNSTHSLMGNLNSPEQQQSQEATSTLVDDEHDIATNYLIPRNVLLGILECAILYKNSCNTTGSNNKDIHQNNSEQNYYLMEFITESYTTFMTHVRTILLQEDNRPKQSNQHTGNFDDDEDDNDDDGDDDIGQPQEQYNITPEEISKALVVLVQYVQEFTTGLVDNVQQLNVDYTNQLMKHAIDLATSMIQRRVNTKFRQLQYMIVNDCVLPFTNRIISEHDHFMELQQQQGDTDDSNNGSNMILPEIIQSASSTLSDCLQLIDDTIRSICMDNNSSSGSSLTASNIDNSSGSNNSNIAAVVVATVPSDVRDAVHVSTYRLVSWLANTFEILVGGDPTDFNHIAEAQKIVDDDSNENSSNGRVSLESSGDDWEEELLTLVYSARQKIQQACCDNETTIHSDIVLTMIELCRLSETLVPQHIAQSLQLSGGGGKKKLSSSQRGELFTSSSSHETTTTYSATTTNNRLKGGADGSSNNDERMSKRFRVAGSRIFTIFITTIAYEATYRLLSNIADMAIQEQQQQPRPSDSILAIVQYAKILSLQCSTLFGGTKRAGPVPIWDDSTSSATSNRLLSNRKTGLYLDVERMFKETVTIYPHPSEIMEYSRDTAIFLYFKIVFRAWYEAVKRQQYYSYSSLGGYLQIQIDTIFVKYMIPHYLSHDYTNEHGTNGRTALGTLIGDIIEVVDDHRQSTDTTTDRYSQEDSRIQREAHKIVQSFMVSVDSNATMTDLFIIKES